jgi:D-beta-D-heptose 7-phosphate kinase / D-beta-D-heptose 1-phosphate adenosyltransferase
VIAAYEREQSSRCQSSFLDHTGEAIMTLTLELTPAKAQRILVVGEVVLDRYLWGTVERISPEAPIPVLRLSRSEERLGNAAFVAASVCALGAEASLLSVIGADADGRAVCRIADDQGIGHDSLLEEPDRPTIVKERLLGAAQSARRGIQQMLRVDREDLTPLHPAAEAKLLARLDAELEDADGVLVSDINKGLLTPRLLREIIQATRSRSKPLVIDPRRCDDFSIYRGATALTPNRFETELATGLDMTEPDLWPVAARKLIHELDLDACLVTLDRDGMFLAQQDGTALHIEITPRDVYDVTGAGDVVLATFGLFLTAGLTAADASALANVAASLEVAKQGAMVISRDELIMALEGSRHASSRKILSLPELQAELLRHRHAGRTICFTNGCFDLLHAGHVKLLEFAHSQGDLLVVAINSDGSVRQIKGVDRPIYSAADRARILAALEAVDYVVIFDDPRAEDIVRSIRPDVLIKGEDWAGKTVDGGEFVRSYGGRVVLAQLMEGRATSRTIEHILSDAMRRYDLQDTATSHALSGASLPAPQMIDSDPD